MTWPESCLTRGMTKTLATLLRPGTAVDWARLVTTVLVFDTEPHTGGRLMYQMRGLACDHATAIALLDPFQAYHGGAS